ncbi:MAG: hypothetical protein LBL54_01750 [Clostridiales Family XIII bacterium]|jgi:hypothetical protein|nr:hypothetical protein [Clostridiales Family XIII bacterium]
MRNFLYNKSDILIAIIIIAAAAIIIWTRVDAIMGSDEKDDGATTVGTGEELPTPDAETSDAAVDAPPAGGETDGETPPTDGEVVDPDAEDPDGEALVEGDEPIEFTVEVGSAASTVAKDLASAGLVETADAFLSELTAQNAETKLKAGIFEITPGTSVSDIVKKLTN